MMKKLLLVGAIAAVAVVGFKGTKVVRDVVHAVKAHAQPTVEDQLADMRKEVSKLDKDADRLRDALAKEIVDVRDLNGRTTELRAAVEKERKELLARGEEIKDGTEKVKHGTGVVVAADAKAKLMREVNLHNQKKKTLEFNEKTLVAREAIRETLQKQLAAVNVQKQELLAQIDDLEADYRQVQLQQIENKYQFDDSRMAKIKEQLRELRKTVDVEKVKLELTPKAEDKVSAVEPIQSVDEILAQLKK